MRQSDCMEMFLKSELITVVWQYLYTSRLNALIVLPRATGMSVKVAYFLCADTAPNAANAIENHKQISQIYMYIFLLLNTSE